MSSSNQSGSGGDAIIWVLIAGAAGSAVVTAIVVSLADVGEWMARRVGSACPTGPYLEGDGLFRGAALLTNHDAAGEGAARVLDGWLALGELLLVLGLLGLVGLYLFFRHRDNSTDSRSRRSRYQRSRKKKIRRALYAVPWSVMGIGVMITSVLVLGGFTGADCIAGLGHLI